MTTERLYMWDCMKCHDYGHVFSTDSEAVLDTVSDHVNAYSTKCNISDVNISEYSWMRDINYNQEQKEIWENNRDPDVCPICDKDDKGN